MVGVCPNTFSAQEQSGLRIHYLLCFIFGILSVACSIAVAGADIEGGRTSTELGILEFLLEEMNSKTDYMDGVIVAEDLKTNAI